MSFVRCHVEVVAAIAEKSAKKERLCLACCFQEKRSLARGYGSKASTQIRSAEGYRGKKKNGFAGNPCCARKGITTWFVLQKEKRVVPDFTDLDLQIFKSHLRDEKKGRDGVLS